MSGAAPAPRIRELVVELARALRAEVLPHTGRPEAREHSGGAAGGDVTFAIDERAESLMERFLAERAPGVAFFSEDRGLVVPAGDAQWVLIVDPIDGTRPALAGLEAACVSVAAAELGDQPRMDDVRVGCVTEIKSGAEFVAERNAGVIPQPRLSANGSLERMLWTYGFRGRPALELATVLAELIDTSSVGGATFDLGSATFDMTRLVTGQLDAYVEPGPLMVSEVAGMRERFEQVGGGAVLNNTPYDLAAAALILTEAGAVVTDAEGRPLGDRPLLGSGPEFQMSCIAAANAQLHKEICAAVDRGIQRLVRAGVPERSDGP